MAGGKVLLSEGTLYSEAPIVIPAAGEVTIEGQGIRATTYRKPGGGGNTHNMFEIYGAATDDRSFRVSFKNMRINGDGKAGRGLDCKWADRIVLRDVEFSAIRDNAIFAERCYLWDLDNVLLFGSGWAPTTKSVVVFYNGDTDFTNEWSWRGCRWELCHWTEIESDASGAGSTSNGKMRFTDCKIERINPDTVDAPMITGPFGNSSWINLQTYSCMQSAMVLEEAGANNEIIGGNFSNLCQDSGRGDIDIASDRNRVTLMAFIATGADQHVYLAATAESNIAGAFSCWNATSKLPILDLGTKNRILPCGSNTNTFPAADSGVFEGWVLDGAQNPLLGQLPINAVVTSVDIWVEEAFNAGGADDSLTVGWDADSDAFVATGLDMTTLGLREHITEAHGNAGATLGTVDATSRRVEAYLTHTGAEPTTGKAHITIHYSVASAEPA